MGLLSVCLICYFVIFKKTIWDFEIDENANYNIILVSIDTIKADHLPCYGYKKNTAPNICSLAKHGYLFDIITHTYLTPTGMMSMFTSKHASITGFTDFVSVLPKKIPTFPEN